MAQVHVMQRNVRADGSVSPPPLPLSLDWSILGRNCRILVDQTYLCLITALEWDGERDREWGREWDREWDGDDKQRRENPGTN